MESVTANFFLHKHATGSYFLPTVLCEQLT